MIPVLESPLSSSVTVVITQDQRHRDLPKRSPPVPTASGPASHEVRLPGEAGVPRGDTASLLGPVLGTLQASQP